jgi:hypothetical protein
MPQSPYSSPNVSEFDSQLPTKAGSIYIGSLSSGLMSNIDSSIISVSVNYSMNEASQLSFEVLESMTTDYSRIAAEEKTFPRVLNYAENAYFEVGRDVVYETTTLNDIFSSENSTTTTQVKQKQLFEISSVTFQQGPGGSPTWSIDCYSKAIQQMKRDRKPSSIKGNGTEYVKRAAAKFGLKFWGQETTKKYSITKASGDKQADSVWDVLTRLAGDSKFVLFEVNGILIFASETYLLHKWGINYGDTVQVYNTKKRQNETKTTNYIPLQYPAVVKGTPGAFVALKYPTVTVSNNDPRYGSGSIIVDRANGTQIRPGMTTYVGNVPGLNGYYLVESVSFEDRTPNPVSVNFRKPTKEEKNIKELPVGLLLIQTDDVFAVPTRATAKTKKLPTPAPIPAEILPLPTSSSEYSYPRFNNNLIQSGNIPLYSRPVLTVNGEVKTTFSITIFQRPDLSINEGSWVAGNTAVLITPIWTIDGAANEISASAARDKYLSDGLFLAKLSTPAAAKAYAELIHRQQIEILRNRFPAIDFYNGGIYPNTAGLT